MIFRFHSNNYSRWHLCSTLPKQTSSQVLQRPWPLSPPHSRQKHHVDLHQPQKLSHPSMYFIIVAGCSEYHFKLILLIDIMILRCRSCKFSCCLILLNVLFSREWVGSETQLEFEASPSTETFSAFGSTLDKEIEWFSKDPSILFDLSEVFQINSQALNQNHPFNSSTSTF